MRAWFVSLALFALDRGASTPVFTAIDLHTGRLFFKRCREAEAIVAFVRRSSNRVANHTSNDIKLYHNYRYVIPTCRYPCQRFNLASILSTL